MIASAVAWLIAKGLTPRLARPLVIAALITLAIVAAVLAWRTWLSDHDDAVIDTHEAEVTADVLTSARAADAHLAERRTADERALAAERKDFDNATTHLAPSGLTPRQRVDACRQLRAQGEAQAVLAAAGCL
jgi:hypothetical protein